MVGLRGFGSVVAGIGLAVACGGSTSTDGDGTGGAGSGGGGAGGMGATGGTIVTGGFGGIGATGGIGGKDAGKDAKTGGTGGTYVDPGCPDAPPPPPIKDCDPFGPNTCKQGEACYPFVQYPSKPCEQEIFGAICAPVGTGKQGDPCGAQNCAGGFVCVVTGQGTECVQLCDLFGAAKCPPGLFCVPIDVEGIGGCY